MLANCWEIKIPESFSRGFPPWIFISVATFFYPQRMLWHRQYDDSSRSPETVLKKVKKLMLATCWEINIPESPPKGFPLRVLLKFMSTLSLESTLVFLPFTAIGIRDDCLLWTLLSKSLCRRAVLSALSLDEELLTLSLHRRVILTGILDFSCGGFWSSFFSGRSQEAIVSHSRFCPARKKLK